MKTRRTFIKKLSAATAGAMILNTLHANRSWSISVPRHQPQADKLFVGTPVLPVYLYEQGIATVLDQMQEIAGINTVMTFSHTHVARQYRENFAPLTDNQGNEITDVFVHTNARYYADQAMQGKNPAAKYADRDLLDELQAEAAPRNIQVYARILEPYVITGAIPGFDQFAEVDAKGQKSNHVCFNHPRYIGYWDSVVTDLVRTHPRLQGFKFGQERGGPLLGALNGKMPACFCKHCIKIARSRGFNPQKAREAMLALYDFGNLCRNQGKPRDGYFVSFMRLLGQHPDLLSWERLWMDSRENQRKRIYTLIKALNPDIQVGWHIDHGMTWDLITRAFNDYSTMGPYSDWLSTAVYFDSMGRRSTNHYKTFYRNLLFGDATDDVSYPMYISMLGYDPHTEPGLDQHLEHDTAFSSEYVYRECRRAVEAVKGSTRVYARPGFDMPDYNCNVTADQVYAAVTRALDAGVNGLWCGREWDEIKPSNAQAFGNAVRDYSR